MKVKRAYFTRPFCDEWKLIGENISREKTSRVTISLTFFSVEIGLYGVAFLPDNTVREQPPRLCKNNNSKINLSVLESVYIMTQNPLLCKQKEFIFSLGIFKQTMVIGLIGHSWGQLDGSSHVYSHLAT